MQITWLGHDAFLFVTEDGTKILTDPYEAGSYGGAVGYKKIEEEVDVTVVSHAQHPDHGDYQSLRGNPQVILGPGTHTAKGLTFKGVATFHDKSQGRERGENTVFVFEVDGIRICHLGDLGHVLTDEQVKEIGAVDILFVPVGGYYTIDHKEAIQVAEQLSPKIIIPMHYKTDVLGFPLDKVDKFLKGKKNIESIKGYDYTITTKDLPTEPKIVVFEEHKL